MQNHTVLQLYAVIVQISVSRRQGTSSLLSASGQCVVKRPDPAKSPCLAVGKAMDLGLRQGMWARSVSARHKRIRLSYKLSLRKFEEGLRSRSLSALRLKWKKLVPRKGAMPKVLMAQCFLCKESIWNCIHCTWGQRGWTKASRASGGLLLVLLLPLLRWALLRWVLCRRRVVCCCCCCWRWVVCCGCCCRGVGYAAAAAAAGWSAAAAAAAAALGAADAWCAAAAWWSRSPRAGGSRTAGGGGP